MVVIQGVPREETVRSDHTVLHRGIVGHGLEVNLRFPQPSIVSQPYPPGEIGHRVTVCIIEGLVAGACYVDLIAFEMGDNLL